MACEFDNLKINTPVQIVNTSVICCYCGETEWITEILSVYRGHTRRPSGYAAILDIGNHVCPSCKGVYSALFPYCDEEGNTLFEKVKVENELSV